MKALFDLMFEGSSDVLWHSGAYAGYNGPIIGGSKQVCVTGGFGNILYQNIQVPTFNLWDGNYNIFASGIARARSPIRSIELNCIMSGGLEQRSAPHPMRYLFAQYINLSHTLSMDSKVKLIKGMRHRTFDLHYTIQALKQIIDVDPEIIGQFINEYEANRQMRLFADDVRPSPEIIRAIDEMARYALRKDRDPEVLEYFGRMLLIQVFLYKRLLNGKKGLDKMQKRVLVGLETLRQALLRDIQFYENTKYYAIQYLNICETDLRKHFQNAYDLTPFAYWRSAKMDNALYLLLNTDQPIKDIAYATGFISSKSLTKEFKKYYEIAPLKYRKLMIIK